MGKVDIHRAFQTTGFAVKTSIYCTTFFRNELAQVVFRCPDIINVSERVLNRTVFVASAAPDA